MCKDCEYYDYNKENDVSMCICGELMTAKEYDRYFGDRLKGCPFYLEKDTELYIERKRMAV